jgi:formylglycine-generating enzyme required for sulfatase activity
MGTNPSGFKNGDVPAVMISWNDAQAYIIALNNLTGKKYRLPTEAEWEYAARGGKKSQGYKYSGSDNVDAVAWYDENSGYISHPVGTKEPNELGIYDMSGNVWEWCSDWYDGYSDLPQTNPPGPSSGLRRVIRGGNYILYAQAIRVSMRSGWDPNNLSPYIGFRLAHP